LYCTYKLFNDALSGTYYIQFIASKDNPQCEYSGDRLLYVVCCAVVTVELSARIN